MEEIISCRIVSGMTKALLTDTPKQFPEMHTASALKGDRVYLSLVGTPKDGSLTRLRLQVKASAQGLPCRLFSVEQVPVRLPHTPTVYDSDYLGHKPGLYPDLLRPTEKWTLSGGQCAQMLLEIEIPKNAKHGTYAVVFQIFAENEMIASAGLTLKVINAVLPPQTLLYSQWMYLDCLADAYCVKIFSPRHWKLIENAVKSAGHSGVNVLLTPIFTPPLDTAVGGERPTVQLVDITLENGEYTFGFDRLKRFCRMAKRCGIKELEICHLFTQWGAEHAPKIVAKTDSGERKIFGWETNATSEEYVRFLRTFLPQLKNELDRAGYRWHYFFHISDEPNSKHYESFRAAKEAVYDLICDHPVRDALSRIEYYDRGLVRAPIPATNHADEFVARGVPDLWVYYCCTQGKDVSNRFIAMPGHRTRMIGAQMYKAGVTGFLHWGYNFYYTQFSTAKIDPFLITDGDYFAPAGDTFSVYPGEDGTPLHSIREAHFYMALTDMRAMALAEKYAGRDRVIREIDRLCAVDFRHYPDDPAFPDELRERINHLIETCRPKNGKSS